MGDRPMIGNVVEYEKACEKLAKLEAWLDELRRHNHPGREKGLTKAGVRKMIAPARRHWPVRGKPRDEENTVALNT